jgi:hypothetical protein
MGNETKVSSGDTTPAREAFSVSEWCGSIGISRAFFYKLPQEQRPTVIRLGRRSLITRQASAEWQERMMQRAEGQA